MHNSQERAKVTIDTKQVISTIIIEWEFKISLKSCKSNQDKKNQRDNKTEVYTLHTILHSAALMV